jgi:ParB-like chromosome segregation protein Spo0J
VIAESLKVSGQYRAIVVNLGTHTGREFEILAGNHTAEAARSLGWATVSAHIVDLDEEGARRIVLADNRTNDVADYDTQGLIDLLREQEDLAGTGFTPGDVDDLIATLAHYDSGDLDSLADEFGEPEDGDLWVTFTMRLPQGLKGRLEAAIAAQPGADDAQRVTELLAKIR